MYCLRKKSWKSHYGTATLRYKILGTSIEKRYNSILKLNGYYYKLVNIHSLCDWVKMEILFVSLLYVFIFTANIFGKYHFELSFTT